MLIFQFWFYETFIWIWMISAISLRISGCREQPPHGAPWVSGLVGHFVQTWPDCECSHTVQFLDSVVLRL